LLIKWLSASWLLDNVSGNRFTAPAIYINIINCGVDYQAFPPFSANHFYLIPFHSPKKIPKYL